MLGALACRKDHSAVVSAHSKPLSSRSCNLASRTVVGVSCRKATAVQRSNGYYVLECARIDGVRVALISGSKDCNVSFQRAVVAVLRVEIVLQGCIFQRCGVDVFLVVLEDF